MRFMTMASAATLAGAIALVGTAAPAAAQIGAIAAAAAVSGANQGGEYALSGAPVFSESGLILTDGWSINGFAVSTSTSFDETPLFLGYEFSTVQMTVGGFAAINDRVMVGAVLSPFVSGDIEFSDNTSNSVSGLGDLSLVAKAALTESANGRTRLAASGSVLLAIGDDMVSSGTTAGSLGLGASHQLDSRTSLHGGGSVTLTTDNSDTDFDEGATGFGFSGAVVRQLSPKGWVSGELLGSTGGGEWTLTLAPAGRIKANDNMFVDLGLAFGIAQSDGVVPLDLGAAVGLTYVP